MHHQKSNTEFLRALEQVNLDAFVQKKILEMSKK
jgi:hypothetical protein